MTMYQITVHWNDGTKTTLPEKDSSGNTDYDLNLREPVYKVSGYNGSLIRMNSVRMIEVNERETT